MHCINNNNFVLKFRCFVDSLPLSFYNKAQLKFCCYSSWKSRPTSRETLINHLNGLLENILRVKVPRVDGLLNFRSIPYNICLEVVPTSVLVHYSCGGFLPVLLIHFFAFNINQERFNRTSVTFTSNHLPTQEERLLLHPLVWISPNICSTPPTTHNKTISTTTVH